MHILRTGGILISDHELIAHLAPLLSVPGHQYHGQLPTHGPIEGLDSTTDPRDVNLSKLLEIVKDKGTWHAVVYESQRTEHNLATE